MKEIIVKEMYYNQRHEFSYKILEDDELLIKKIPQDLQQYYPEDYHCHGIKQPVKSFKSKFINLRNSDIVYKRNLGFGSLLNFIKPSPQIYQTLSALGLNPESRILDIGCGSGDLLFDLRNLGCKNLFGIDPFLPDELLDVRNPLFRRKDIFNVSEKFDIIISNHSLEHVYDHQIFFNQLKKICHNGSRILVRMPLSGSKAWNLYRENWYQLDAPRHLHIQSEISFRNLITDVGFIIDKVIYDSTYHQFARSELYQKGISSKEFWDKYHGNYNQVFSTQQLNVWQQQTEKVNHTGEADQASFIISVV